MKWVALVLGGGGIALLGYFALAGDAGSNPGAAQPHPFALTILVGMVLLVLLGLLVVLAFVAGSWWTERQVRLGASIATSAQNVDNHWDERKTAAFASLAREMIRLGQATKVQTPPPPALPSADQEGGWLTPLDSFSVPSPEPGPWTADEPE